MALDLIGLAAGLTLIGIAAIAILNALTFARLASPHEQTEVPQHSISICIPARDEAEVIAATIRSLCAQTCTDLEILILDDHSHDETRALALAATEGDPRVRVLDGADLPGGWLGKNWACHQLSAAARGDVLIFTDADVRWQPEAVAALLAEMTRTRADLLTVWPTQTTITWGERLVVPLMAFVILGYLPALAVHHAPFASLAAANGQCLCFRRSAYVRVGGHQAVRDRIVEDIVFARAIKRAGLRLRTADGGGLIGCRMYASWPQVRDGFAKNIIAGYGGLVGLILGTLFHWLILLFPWLWLIALLLTGDDSRAPIQFVGVFGLCVLGIGVRALTAAVTRQRVGDALLLPISALLMTRIAAQAVWWQLHYGGVRWKGRTIKT
ncbi:MAG: glycosyltransferase [Anaerolineae bacterium]|nr:glycosyltransferase [Anaerolineae bacterium]